VNSNDGDRAFTGSIPQLYEEYLVPLIFEPYAIDIAARAARHRPSRVLELAAGTGAVTRQLAQTLAPDASIIATDLNQPMLDQAAAVGTARAVEWRQADAMQLPFADASFDLVACQFGVMFFPDKGDAFAEARRVLRPGGHLLFNVWDGIEENEFADTVTQALQELFPDDPPRFMARTPHGYHDTSVIARDLKAGGFAQTAEFATVAARSRAESAHRVAVAYCEGTLLRTEIEARAPGRLNEITRSVAAAIAHKFGGGAVDGKIQAHVVTVVK
jgi:SAM-dependent methyltransferase